MHSHIGITIAPIAQWIECEFAELKIEVRFLMGAQI